jgi:hypothetical protein
VHSAVRSGSMWNSVLILTAHPIFDFFVVTPLRKFYFEGPIWKNVPHAEACSQLTQVPSKYWEGSSTAGDECAALLDRRFHSFFATTLCVVYFLTIILLVAYASCRICIIRPILGAIRTSGCDSSTSACVTNRPAPFSLDKNNSFAVPIGRPVRRLLALPACRTRSRSRSRSRSRDSKILVTPQPFIEKKLVSNK